MRHKVLTILLAAILCAAPQADARKVRKSLKTTKTAKSKGEDTTTKTRVKVPDTASIRQADGTLAIFRPDSVRLTGYDKQLTSSNESLFIVNNSPAHIVGVDFEITYLDMAGEMLHHRKVSVNSDIPSGETHKIDFKSWDTQRSFYYHRSAVPRRDATPYRVSISPASFLIRTGE